MVQDQYVIQKSADYFIQNPILQESFGCEIKILWLKGNSPEAIGVANLSFRFTQVLFPRKNLNKQPTKKTT